jgi:hypothetical protein
VRLGITRRLTCIEPKVWPRCYSSSQDSPSTLPISPLSPEPGAVPASASSFAWRLAFLPLRLRGACLPPMSEHETQRSKYETAFEIQPATVSTKDPHVASALFECTRITWQLCELCQSRIFVDDTLLHSDTCQPTRVVKEVLNQVRLRPRATAEHSLSSISPPQQSFRQQLASAGSRSGGRAAYCYRKVLPRH